MYENISRTYSFQVEIARNCRISVSWVIAALFMTSDNEVGPL
jgi:hypothetical protein